MRETFDVRTSFFSKANANEVSISHVQKRGRYELVTTYEMLAFAFPISLTITQGSSIT